MCSARRCRFLGHSIATIVAVFWAVGCASSPRLAWPIPGPPAGSGSSATLAPTPASPVEVLRLLAWCYEHRDVTRHRELYSDDFRFTFPVWDPSAEAFRDSVMTRDAVLEDFDLLVKGTAGRPVPVLAMTMDENLRVEDDPSRPGPAHKIIRTVLTITLDHRLDSPFTSHAVFTLVRGESAIDRGPRVPSGMRDSGRWSIERWQSDSPQGTLRSSMFSGAGFDPIRGLYR